MLEKSCIIYSILGRRYILSYWEDVIFRDLIKVMVFIKEKIDPGYFERKAWADGRLVCGIDEAGRGCLAGPVVAAAAILPVNCSRHFIDSKKLSEKQRNEDFEWIMSHCRVAYAVADHMVVDQCNIYRATKRLMHRAYVMLMAQHPTCKQAIKYLVSDAVPLAPHGSVINKKLEIHHFNYGELTSPSIAAASVVAKVTRDRIMKNMNNLFPMLLFHKHKGYGTREHMAQIKSCGITLVHRRSFITHARKEDHEEQQRSLF